MEDVDVAEAELLPWTPISPHLASARLKEVTVNLPALLVCDPTLDAEDEDFQYAIDSVPSGGLLIVAVDWNAAPAGMLTQNTLSKFALGPRCANGDRLVIFE